MEVTLDQLAEFERRATMAERERCALIAENYPIVAPSSVIVVQTTMEVAAMSIADEIRTGRTTETRSTISRRDMRPRRARRRMTMVRIFAWFGWALMPIGDARTLHWMARRYADGRQSASAWSFNHITRKMLVGGICRTPEDHPDKTIWARDGSGDRKMDGLTDAEAALGDEWVNRNLRMVQASHAAQ